MGTIAKGGFVPRGPYFARSLKMVSLALLLAASLGLAETKAKSGKEETEGNVLSYMKARQLVLDGNYEAAIPYLEAALKNDPESAQINHELGDALLRVGNFERAEVLTRKALEKEPENLQYRSTLAGIYASLKRYPEAKEQYQKIIKATPGDTKYVLLLGILQTESGEVEEGVKTITKLVESNPDNFMAYFYRAKIYLELEKINEAKADLDKSLTLRPSFVEAGTALGLLHERLGEVDQAIAVYNKIQGGGRYKKRLAQLYLTKNEFDKALDEFVDYEKLEPDDYAVKVKVGLIYFELKRYTDAVTKFQTILKEQPEAGNVRFYLGVVYEEMKQLDKSIAEFKKVPADSSFFKEAMLHVGFAYKDLGKHKEGMEFAKKTLAKNPKIVEFYDMQASFHEVQKELKKALAVIEDGLKKFPGDEKLLYFQGALLDKLGDRKQAITNMKKILDTNPNNAHAMNFLAYTYAELGENLSEAEQLVLKALTLRPGDGFIEDSLGWILFKQGKTDQALEHLEKAATLQPQEAIIFEHLGDAYSQKKDTAKAVTNYEKAVQLATQKKDVDSTKKVESKIAAIKKDQRVPSTTK